MRVGIDIVKVKRISEAIKNSGQTFLDKHFFPTETANMDPKHLAGVFAAKEAVFKTGVIQEMDFLRVMVVYDEDGRPEVVNADGSKIDYLDVSISHTNEMAEAVAIWDPKKTKY